MADERAARFSEECQLLSVGLLKFQLIFKSHTDDTAEARPRNADSAGVIERSRASYSAFNYVHILKRSSNPCIWCCSSSCPD